MCGLTCPAFPPGGSPSRPADPERVARSGHAALAAATILSRPPRDFGFLQTAVISRGGPLVLLDDGVAEPHADAGPGRKRQLPVTDDRFRAD
jgi:hypothetical protein